MYAIKKLITRNSHRITPSIHATGSRGFCVYGLPFFSLNFNGYAIKHHNLSKRHFQSSRIVAQNAESLAEKATGGVPQVENSEDRESNDFGLDGLLIAPRAERRIIALRKKGITEGKENAEKLLLRLRVDGGGCGGFKYDFSLEYSDIEEGDMTFGQSGPIVVVDDVSMEFVKGATIDWDDSMVRSSFVVSTNPNAESSCGCKSSFSFKM